MSMVVKNTISDLAPGRAWALVEPTTALRWLNRGGVIVLQQAWAARVNDKDGVDIDTVWCDVPTVIAP